MCEPSHSIIQYPTVDPESQDPIRDAVRMAVSNAHQIEINEAPNEEVAAAIKSSLILPQGVISGHFINYSRLGSGHSEAIGKLPVRVRSRLPEDVKYEAHWWDRSVKLDSRMPQWVKLLGQDESKDSATVYAERTSIGDLKIFRRFFENSLLHSERPNNYVEPFFLMLSVKGFDTFTKSLKRIFNGKLSISDTLYSVFKSKDKKTKAKVIGVMLKMTRNRENLVCEWADDSKLWVPESKVLV